MSLNPPPSGYGGSLSVQATPTRDRDRHPFPQSSNPSPATSMRQSSSSAASGSFATLPSSSLPPTGTSSTQVMTIESLLSQHATSPDPVKSALAQAVADRNNLSSQNTQLWKLIEKQRTGYNQILKELERIRSERDSYKSKLTALARITNGSIDKALSERPARPSLDTISSIISTNVPSSQNRSSASASAPRHNSEDHVTARSNHIPQPLHTSRSYDPMAFRTSEDDHQQNGSNASSVAVPSRTSSPPPAQSVPAPVTPSARHASRPPPSPLVVPNRVDTLSSYTTSDSPSSSTSSSRLPTDDANTVPNNAVGNGIYASSANSTRILPHPRKSSMADSISSLASSTTTPSASTYSSLASSNTSTHNFGGNQAPPSQLNPSGLTPSIAPAGFSNPFASSSESLVARQRGLPPAASSPAINQPTSTLNSSPLVSGSANAQPQPQTLSVAEGRQYSQSRDSRISLPDEASRYIQSMTDSPIASPRIDAFSPKSKLSTSVFPPSSDGANTAGRESEFLDMEEDEEEGDSDEGSISASAADTTITDDPAISEHATSLSISSTAPGQDNNTNNTSNRHAGLPYSHTESANNYLYHFNSSRDDLDSKSKDRSRGDLESFSAAAPYSQRLNGLGGQDQASQLYTPANGQQPRQQPGSQQAQAVFPTQVPMSSSKHAQATSDQYHNTSSSHHPPEDSHTPMYDAGHPSQAQSPYRSEATSKSSGPSEGSAQPQPAAFRALPLLSSDLPNTTITVSHSFVRPNDRGKEVLSFIVTVNPGGGKESWKVEKMYSDVLSLDQRVRNSVGRGVGRKIANLPEGKLWKDHAPAKVDQRKAVLENYLQTLIRLPVKSNDEVIAFFTSDIVRDQKQPVMQAGHKEGYLTKRGKNFGGWKTRFFVLQGPVLEYYDCRGGTHLGSITITGAQIARQHRTERPPSDDEKEYRHAFLIVEAKKGPGGNHPRHVLCAESDEDRDSWVEMLVRYYTGTYSDDLVFNSGSGVTSVQSSSAATASTPMGQPRLSMSSTDVSSVTSPRKMPVRGVSRDDISRGSAMPIALLPPDASNAKLFQAGPTAEDYLRSSSPSRSIDPSPIDRQGPSASGGFDVRQRSLGQPSSLPDPSPLSSGQIFPSSVASDVASASSSSSSTQVPRANSEMGHYPDLANDGRPSLVPVRKEHRPREERKSFYPSLNASPAPERVPSPEKLDASSKVKISGPMNGAPIPSGFKFGGKEPPPGDASAAPNDRREKAKSRSFWGFGKVNGDKSQSHAAFPPRAVFGVPLEEALEVAQICNLPAIVFRSIQYLQAKKADQEEGIYRLSGSSAVIKNLKDMFNSEGDVDLLASDEYWDPHAIAGLLKSFLRELPSSILTRDLHLKFLAVIDFVDPQERIRELSSLIAALPIANYTLLRALTAHLILIVQNSNVNKMTMRNVGIVFSPTLGIPAGVFSLMLGEFNRVFNVDADGEEPPAEGTLLEHPTEPLRRNSRQYSDAAADQLLGLTASTLTVAPASSTEEMQSDGDDFSLQEESGNESERTPPGSSGGASASLSESSPSSVVGPRDPSVRVTEPTSPSTPTAWSTSTTTSATVIATPSKAASAAASRGLNVVTVTHSERGNRHSRMIGLPSSPRPPGSPSREQLQPPES